MNVYWGDTHHNTYQHCRQDPPLGDVLDFARTHLDFYTGAYYTAIFTQYGVQDQASAGAATGPAIGHAYEAKGSGGTWQGVRIERLKPAEALASEWEEFVAILRAQHTPGEFVTFPGYEWQGDATWGDHNVIFPQEGNELYAPPSLPELYAYVRERGALAIPHHTCYLPGMRAPRWDQCDTELSPFAEVFSVHGCSETDDGDPGMYGNPHMGPGTTGGTYQAALKQGLRLGAICSTDNWTNMPGHWGHGLMGCLAPDLSRESLWEAFRARRVYGVTGDRIDLRFWCNEAPMGSVIGRSPKRRLAVAVRGCDAIDRIEILRNEEVIHAYSHQGTWHVPECGGQARMLLRLEAGWGPLIGEIPWRDMRWDVDLRLSSGCFLGWSPCWRTRGQGVPALAGGTAKLHLEADQMVGAKPNQNGVILELLADPAAELTITDGSKTENGPLADFLAAGRIVWYPEETRERVKRLTGVVTGPEDRLDMYYHMSPKMKIHRAIPEAGYTAQVEIQDDAPVGDGLFYRVRVQQRNGQRAWSSPIWVE
jgi:hypothetical protein